jgi:hypothetical protein
VGLRRLFFGGLVGPVVGVVFGEGHSRHEFEIDGRGGGGPGCDEVGEDLLEGFAAESDAVEDGADVVWRGHFSITTIIDTMTMREIRSYCVVFKVVRKGREVEV